MTLTNTEVLKAKPSPSPIKMADGRGLYLLITPAGSKLWRWKYRFLGKEKLMAAGAYPDVSLAQARDKVDEARKQLAAGSDPMAARKFEKIARRLAVEDTFRMAPRSHGEDRRSCQPVGQSFRRQKPMAPICMAVLDWITRAMDARTASCVASSRFSSSL